MNNQQEQPNGAHYNPYATPPATPYYIVVQSSPDELNYDNDDGGESNGDQTFLNQTYSPPPPYSIAPPAQVYDPTQPMVPAFRVQQESDIPVNLFLANQGNDGSRGFVISRPHEVSINKQQVDDAYKRAVLSCICCFIPLGICAIWNAKKADDSHINKSDKVEEFVRASLKFSKLACQVGTILCIVYAIIVIIIAKQFS